MAPSNEPGGSPSDHLHPEYAFDYQRAKPNRFSTRVDETRQFLCDPVAVTVARVVAAANRRAQELGVQVERSWITVTHCSNAEADTWRVNYLPPDQLERRGGDLIIDVDARSGDVVRVLRGQ